MSFENIPMEINTHIKPYGGTLQNLVIDDAQGEQLKSTSENYLSITLSNRQVCDLEMLVSGAYSPLTGFMDEATYESVVNQLTLLDGTVWPLPVIFDITEDISTQVSIGTPLALRDSEGFMLATMEVSEIWKPDQKKEAQLVYGTDSKEHPGVRYLFDEVGKVYICGKLSVAQLPKHYVFDHFRYTPKELRSFFERNSWHKILGYQTSAPMHRLHKDMLMDVVKQHHTQLLIQPTVGTTKPGDTHYFHRVKCYQNVINKFPLNIAKLSLIPHSMRMAGPRETLLHGIIHQNYGCSHFFVGSNHASPITVLQYYGKYDAQRFVEKYQQHLDIMMVGSEEYQYHLSRGKYQPKSLIDQEQEKGLTLTESEFRNKLHEGLPIPDWFSFPEVIQELKKTYQPRSKQGFTVFFTGLSGSGKSTLAKIVYAKLVEHGSRPVTLLDGDVVRLNLSSELGFSKPHRDLNIRRIGFVSNEISKNGGVAICAPIAPYAHGRRAVRELIEQEGAFIEVHVATPLEECEARDRKGLYAKARKGIIPEFTGISDPYEIPENPELVIDTTDISPADGAQRVLLHLLQQGFLDDT